MAMLFWQVCQVHSMGKESLPTSGTETILFLHAKKIFGCLPYIIHQNYFKMDQQIKGWKP